jgi:hypothetical protein
MPKLDQPFLKDMLQRLEDGERYALSPDRFAEIFPPGHQDEGAMAIARRFAATHRCILDYWLGTNEVFFTKLARMPAMER